eukprot:3581568-Amphidinium_carterae.1
MEGQSAFHWAAADPRQVKCIVSRLRRTTLRTSKTFTAELKGNINAINAVAYTSLVAMAASS